MAQFESYCQLYLRWNAKLNLSAIRDREGILQRHFLESIACARVIPADIKTLLDLGSGGGFPGVPIAICRPDIAVTLAESQTKKAAFLREIVRNLGITSQVHGGRAETIAGRFDCVTLRAVDRMVDMVAVATRLLNEGGTLTIMTTESEADLVKGAARYFRWNSVVRSAGDSKRVILLGTAARCKTASDVPRGT